LGSLRAQVDREGGADTELSVHNAYQESTFDAAADFFASPEATPAGVVPRMQRIATGSGLDATSRILDVATGTGALLPFFQAAGADLTRLIGVDLSAGMLAHAKKAFPEATFVKGDILDFVAPMGEKFDRIIFNAVFGNLFDQAAVLRHVTSELLADGGLVVISHPLGRRWLREVLHRKDPQMVPYDIPGERDLRQLVAEAAPSLSIVRVDDEADFYCAVLRHDPLH